MNILVHASLPTCPGELLSQSLYYTLLALICADKLTLRKTANFTLSLRLSEEKKKKVSKNVFYFRIPQYSVHIVDFFVVLCQSERCLHIL